MGMVKPYTKKHQQAKKTKRSPGISLDFFNQQIFVISHWYIAN